MSVKEFFNLFLIVSALHGFLFSIILTVSKNGKQKSIVYINLLVLVISLNNLQSWVVAKNFFKTSYFLDYIHMPWHFLIAPFFYMFLINYLNIATKSKNILKVILPIFVLILLVRVCFIYFYKDTATLDVNYLFEKYTSIEESVSLLFSVTIFSYTYYILSKKENLSNDILKFDNLKWIHIFFKLGALTYAFWMFALAITIALDFKAFIYSYYPLRVLTTVLIYWVGYQSILQLRVINEKRYLRHQLNSSTSNTTPNIATVAQHKLDIPDAVIQTILERLQLFEDTKAYTAKNLTLNILSKKLETNSNYLSKIINTYKDSSFSNYLNTLRINNIVNQLEQNKTIRKFKIKAIADEAGFNTTDSFSKVFFKIIKA